MERQEFLYIRNINSLVQDYMATGQLSKLDVLGQLSRVLITDDHIISNINERYPEVSGAEIVASVKSDLSGKIPSSQRTPWQDFVKFYLKVNCHLTLKTRLESSVISCSPEQKMVIGAFLNLCELGGEELRGAVDLTYFMYSCEAAFMIPRKTVDNWLVGIGFTNRWHYSSKYISHSAWDIPEWVFLASHDMTQNPKQFGIARNAKNEMEEVLKQEEVIALITWLGGKIYGNWKGLIDSDEWEKGKNEIENKFGPKSFENQFFQQMSSRYY